MQDYRKVHAWQKSHRLVLRTYAVTSTFPKAELFGLTSQMRRAAVSIPANIAEGCSRGGPRFQAQSLRIALGSAGELQYYILLATDLKLLSASISASFGHEATDVKKVVTGFLRAVVSEMERAERADSRQ